MSASHSHFYHLKQEAEGAWCGTHSGSSLALLEADTPSQAELTEASVGWRVSWCKQRGGGQLSVLRALWGCPSPFIQAVPHSLAGGECCKQGGTLASWRPCQGRSWLRPLILKHMFSLQWSQSVLALQRRTPHTMFDSDVALIHSGC